MRGRRCRFNGFGFKFQEVFARELRFLLYTVAGVWIQCQMEDFLDGVVTIASDVGGTATLGGIAMNLVSILMAPASEQFTPPPSRKRPSFCVSAG